MRAAVRSFETLSQVAGAMGAFARLCRARIEEISSRREEESQQAGNERLSCFNCGREFPRSQMHEIAAFDKADTGEQVFTGAGLGDITFICEECSSSTA